jgi:hypothetical protein
MSLEVSGGDYKAKSDASLISAVPVDPPKTDLELTPAAAIEASEELPQNENDYFWEILLYIPILFQSVFGTLSIVRSLVLGHAFHRLLQHAPPKWVSFPEGVLQVLPAAAKSHNAWPPPSLLYLAMLTIVALVVHPDGLTWIVLRKLR